MGFRAWVCVGAALVSGAACSALSGLSGLQFDAHGGGGTASSGSHGAHDATSGTGMGGGGAPSSTSLTVTAGTGATCSDLMQDGSETDVDCGGGSCAPCSAGRHCSIDADCAVFTCLEGSCQPTPIGVWTKITAISPPPLRAEVSMGFDGAAIRMTHGHNIGGAPYGNHTYTFDGTNWTQLLTMGGMGSRYGAAVTEGPNGLLLFGGQTGASAYDQDAWAAQGAGSTFTQQTAASPPTGRAHAAIATNGSLAILFGGTTAAQPFTAETWRLDASGWTQLTPSSSPTARTAAAFTYDSTRDQMVLFGGKGAGGALNDLWLWSGNWSSNATPGPGARLGAGMVYVTPRHHAVLVGGTADELTPLSDTWEWNGNAWLRTSTMAPPRWYHGLGYDSTRGRVVLYGGMVNAASDSSETYEYHVHGNACASDGDCDTGHCVDHLCCETASCGSCETCADATTPGVCTGCMNCSGGVCF